MQNHNFYLRWDLQRLSMGENGTGAEKHGMVWIEQVV